MTFRAKAKTVMLKTGRPVSLTGPLLAGTRRPGGGWDAVFRVNGTDVSFKGKRPQEVANRVLTFHRQNGVDLTVYDVWLNLNLQWMARTDQAYFQVDQKTLTDLILENVDREETLRRGFPPEVWGSRAWNWMGLFLAQDTYDPTSFLLVLEQVLQMLNPNTNPTLGCIVCYTEWSALLHTIRLNPPQSRTLARQWLVVSHNKVNRRLGKRELTLDEASALNFWL